jgi:two-component sensor histidine kinase
MNNWDVRFHGMVFLLWVLLTIVLVEPAIAQKQVDQFSPYSKVRVDRDNNDTLDYLGDPISITGVANIDTGLLHEHYLQAFVQNDSAGMSIFAEEIEEQFVVGDSIVAHGHIQRYNGLAEVSVDSYSVYPNAGRLPEPESLMNAIREPQKYLGMLVQGSGTIVEKGSTFNGKYVRLSPSESSSLTMMVYVSNFHRLYEKFDFDVLSIGDEISVTGIISEYNPEYPERQTYKFFLRTPDDLSYNSLPRFYWFAGGGFMVGIFVLVAGWILMLRRQVDKQTKEIKQSLKEKDALLREIHHRVKNSLSIVSGLIGLQLDSTDDETAQNVLQNSQSRIQSVALIHDKLYQTESLDDVELDSYLRELVETLHGTFSEYSDSVDLEFQMEPINIDVDKVIPCGLLINELVVNAYKHAFSQQEQGILKITLHKEGSNAKLSISDNGPGLPEDFDMQSSDSLGTMLIDTFAAQLNAETEIDGKSGTKYVFTFSLNGN